MVISASLLLATCAGCPSPSAQPVSLPPAPQLEPALFLSAPTQSLTLTKVPQLVTPHAPIAVEWSTRSRESSPGVVLRLGSQGALVTRLQARLTRLGYAVEKIDGIFGPLTQAKVMQFQRAYGLVPDGVVEANIWAKLNHDIAHTGRIQPSQQRQSIAQVAKPAPPSTIASPAASNFVLASAQNSLPLSEKTGWIVVLVVLQGLGWLVILQGLNKELMLITGRSVFPGKTKQWLFSVR